jgi:peptidoglycan hydrolase-like protein with peptidoglycan-binding domain
LKQVPAGAEAVACYVDGRFANSAEAARRFPRAHILTIAVFASHDASCLDIEKGDATPGQAAAWYLRQKARGVTRPCLYASAFTMDTEVIPAIVAAGIRPGEVRLWSAHYTHAAHVCGPRSCRELGITADGTQWTDRALGRNLDQSLLAGDFFRPSAARTWTDVMIANLPTLQQGDRDHPGAVQFVHRMQIDVAGIGRWNNLGPVTAIKDDGVFGATTTAAVKVVQKFFGLTADGVCGKQTWSALIAGQRG